MSSEFGTILRVGVFGESPGRAIGVTMQNLPAGERIDIPALEVETPTNAAVSSVTGAAALSLARAETELRVASGAALARLSHFVAVTNKFRPLA